MEKNNIFFSELDNELISSFDITYIEDNIKMDVL